MLAGLKDGGLVVDVVAFVNKGSNQPFAAEVMNVRYRPQVTRRGGAHLDYVSGRFKIAVSVD